RNDPTSSRTCSGELQLRPNRMKPAGPAAAKRSRSKALRRSPEQPSTTASGALSGNDAPDISPLQRAADPIGIRDRRGLEAVKHPLVAEVGTNGCRRNACKQIGVRLLDAVPLLARGVLAAHRTDLDPGSRPLRVRWFCRDSRGRPRLRPRGRTGVRYANPRPPANAARPASATRLAASPRNRGRARGSRGSAYSGARPPESAGPSWYDMLTSPAPARPRTRRARKQ